MFEYFIKFTNGQILKHRTFETKKLAQMAMEEEVIELEADGYEISDFGVAPINNNYDE